MERGPDPEYAAPRSDIEKVLAAIWAEVLRLGPVGIHDSFFELGGHSLLATQLLSRVRGVFEVDLPLGCLFEAPTVAGLAEVLIRREGTPGRVMAIARFRQMIDSLSAEEIEAMLNEREQVVTRPVGG
jgi:hypothetical protein